MKFSESQSKITIEYVRSILDYNPKTGFFTWKWRQGNTPQRNAQWAGKRAGSYLRGYITINIDGFACRAHRLAWFYVTGDWPEDEIDHKNNKKDDNRFDNFRPANRFQNAQNRRKGKNNKSGIKGVSYRKESGLWRARIMLNNRPIHLGQFEKLEDAVRSYNEAAEKYHGEFARVA